MRFETPESKYMSRYFSLEHSKLEEIHIELEKDDLNFMSVSSVEARLLKFFVESHGVKSVVEIGSLYGYSAMAMGLGLPEDGKIYCLEKDQDRADRINKHLSQSSLVCEFDVIAGDALEGLKTIEKEGPFDMVFIDANKGAYCDYLDWAETHTKSGSLIIGDNTFLFGSLWGESRGSKVSQKQIDVMDRFNKRLSDESKYMSIMIPTLEGMTVAKRR